MKEVIMQVQSFSADYPKAPIYVGDLVHCKDCDRKLGSTECPCCTKEYHINEETFYCAWGERRKE